MEIFSIITNVRMILLYLIKEGYKYHQNLNLLAIEENRISEYITYINDNKIKGIFICNIDYSLQNVDFLRHCPTIESVHFLNDNVSNYSGLYYLTNLKYLYADEPIGELNVSHFKYLKELQVNDSKILVGINNCHNIKDLYLTKYKPKTKNLSELSELASLEKLTLCLPNIVSLEGIKHLQKLTYLELYRATRLESIEELDWIKNSLNELRFETCKKIQNPDVVSCLQNLKTLKFINCIEIDNIRFINQMQNLKDFIFVDTNILDGDLSPCLNLEYSGFFNKKHYSHTFKELNDEKYW